jgi:O-antigen biosynthesis protein WbqP
LRDTIAQADHHAVATMSTPNIFWKRIFDNLFSAVGRPFSSHRKTEEFIKRLLDLLLGLAASIVFIAPLLIMALLVKLTSKGPALYWSHRVGRNNVIFSMPKLRTMQVGTAVVATHLLQNPDQCLTPIGGFLRKSSLDELPQLWCILRGDMSVVGPRPALFNQQDLIRLRTEKGVHVLRPGLTGWAQINGRDELPIPEKVELDLYYLRHQSLAFELKIIFLTFLKVVRRDGITH